MQINSIVFPAGNKNRNTLSQAPKENNQNLSKVCKKPNYILIRATCVTIEGKSIHLSQSSFSKAPLAIQDGILSTSIQKLH